MKFLETAIPGAFLVSTEPKADERGFFARTFCRDEFSARGLVADFMQHSVALNRATATLRGMHYQAEPHEETKLVRCLRGSIFDVVVDLRHGSPTRGRWQSFVLAEDTLDSVYIPKGCAHGYLTLSANCLVEYLIDTPYAAGAATGIRYDDPQLDIAWPQEPAVISTRDLGYAPLSPFEQRKPDTNHE